MILTPLSGFSTVFQPKIPNVTVTFKSKANLIGLVDEGKNLRQSLLWE